MSNFKKLKSQLNLLRINHYMQSGSKTLHSIINMHCNRETLKPSYLVFEHKGNVHLEVKLVS